MMDYLPCFHMKMPQIQVIFHIFFGCCYLHFWHKDCENNVRIEYKEEIGMEQKMPQQKSRRKKSVLNRRANVLVMERNDVSAILHIIEQDKTMNPASWQVESLKHSLQMLDQEIGSFNVVHERDEHGSNEQTVQ
jgi:hypothetical protein